MFIHNFIYAIKTMLKNKSVLIWTLLFPMALGTFMYMAFGNIFEKDAKFNVVPVGVVKIAENKNFETLLTELSKEGEDQMLRIKYMTQEEAKEAMEAGKTDSVIYIDEKIKLQVSNSVTNSYNTTIVKAILNEYIKQEKMIMDIATINPAAVEEALKNISAEKHYFTEKITSDGNQDVYTNYFYAIFAMSCLFASFGSVEKIGKLQANVSALGMRRNLSPNSKMVTIVAEFTSMLIVQFVIEAIVLLYFTIIGVDFGSKYPQILVILFFGSCIGISIGIIVGAISKLSETAKQGICILIGMVLSVMADLVAVGVKNGIEHTAPIINRLNPAALIVDSFYALNIYDIYDRYLGNMTILATMTIILIVISAMILRRNRYASV